MQRLKRRKRRSDPTGEPAKGRREEQGWAVGEEQSARLQAPPELQEVPEVPELRSSAQRERQLG